MCPTFCSWKCCSSASHESGNTVRHVIGLPYQCRSSSTVRDLSPLKPIYSRYMAHLLIWLDDYHWSFGGLADAASEGVLGAAARAGHREEVLAA